MKDPRLTLPFFPAMASVTLPSCERSKKNPQTPNQQVFKLDFEHPKREIMDLDQQIGREIDLMVVKLGALDDLQQKLALGQDTLQTDSQKLAVLTSDGTWTKIRTTTELVETLRDHTLKERQGQQANIAQSKALVLEVQNKLCLLNKTRKSAAENYHRGKQQFAIDLQKARERRGELLTEKEHSVCHIRNLILDSKIQIQQKTGELRIELQNLSAEASQTQKDNAQLKKDLGLAKKETPLLENEADNKLLEAEQYFEGLRSKHHMRQNECVQTIEQYTTRTKMLETHVVTTQDQVDRAYCKLRVAEEVANTVKEFFSNIKREHRKLTEQIDELRNGNEHNEIDRREKSLRIDQKYQEDSKRCGRDILLEKAELDKAIEQIKKQETVSENLRDEHATVEKSTWQVRVDEKEADKMICRIKNRLYDEKMKVADIQHRNQSVCAWKLKFQDSGITPHLYLEKLRRQMQEMNNKIDRMRACREGYHGPLPKPVTRICS